MGYSSISTCSNILVWDITYSFNGMSNSPLVSVVLPAYNAGNYVLEAVNSILNQTFVNIELIVVDDCSTDDTLQKLQSLDDNRIKIILQKENKGYPWAMNEAIALARGKYIARMDADDISHPQRIEKQISFLESNPDFPLVSCLRFWTTPFGKPYTLRSALSAYSNSVFFETWDEIIARQKQFTDAGALFLREKVLAIGGYRTYQRSGMDIDLWLRMLEYCKKPAATIAEPLYGRRLLPSAIIFKPETYWRNEIPRLLAVERKEKGIDRIAEGMELADLIEKAKSRTDIDVLKINVLNFHLSCAAQCLITGDIKGAWAFIDACNKIDDYALDKARIYFRFLRKVASYLRHREIIRLDSNDFSIS